MYGGKHSAKGIRLFSAEAKTHEIKDDYDVGKTLGSGTFSVVREGRDRKTGRHVAIKIIDKSNIEVNTDSLKTEVTILKSVRDPNIVELIDVYETEAKVYLVMELLTGGELFDRIVNKYPNGYSEAVASKLVKKMITSISYLHKKGIVHRDLKPENLIYRTAEDDSDLKITDFGLAKLAEGSLVLKTACGTPNYVAPEVLLNEGYTAAVDMWSIGVILYILLCGFPPFYSENTPELFDRIIRGRYDFPSPYWDNVSDVAKDLITRLLRTDPSRRLTPERTLTHAWIRNADVIDRPEVIPELQKFNMARKKLVATVDVVLAAQKFMHTLPTTKKK